MDLQLFASKTGKDWAGEFSENWPRASLKEAIARIAPGLEGRISESGQKRIWQIPGNKLAVVEDITGGNYFRIQDTEWPNRLTSYRLLDGSLPFNVEEGGIIRGRSTDEREMITHFYNTDVGE